MSIDQCTAPVSCNTLEGTGAKTSSSVLRRLWRRRVVITYQTLCLEEDFFDLELPSYLTTICSSTSHHARRWQLSRWSHLPCLYSY